MSLAHHYGVTVDYGALAGVHWPGRCEVIDGVLLDCAHNPDGIDALSTVSHIQRASEVHVIFGVMEGKDVRAMAQSIERWADVVTVVTPDYPRRIPAADVAQSFRNATLKTSVQVALDQRSDEALTVVCGSGFLVAEARAHLLGLEYPECGLRTMAR